MRLRHIEVFHAVYSAGSITGAAKLLNVSQPSVSKVLAHAEQQLGFKLFDRVKGKIIPTQEAERLINHVTDAYDNINELRRVSENIRTTKTGLIRIAMAPAFGIELVPAAIASYLSKHPETSFEIETLHYQQLVRALKQSRVDIGMVFDPPPVPGIAIDHLASAECVAIAHKSMDFASKQRLTLKDLDGMPFINLNSRNPLGRLLASRKKANDIKFNNVAKVETYQMAKALVAEGAGVSIIDEITARSTGHKEVTAWKLEPPLEFNIALLHLEHEPLSIVTQHFVEHLKAAVNAFLKS
ncbi:MAG: LysR family transcriptional regulator [Xanthomonadales bacterium]|nr:LysR family transcriptional regulator [Xanthomonadales bacterium]